MTIKTDSVSLIYAKISINSFPVLTFLELQQPTLTPDENSLMEDSLIATGWETTDYVGVIFLIISLVILVGVVSRRIENAIIFALMVSLLIIALFLFTI
ncbi:hypothetical protein QUB80_29860 [Chlorogloeopsis sp. ULAP01]|uniref:hypothetical protein n=1 Tax=Chlorogloeopsis sp. ULAP01 TaxID=3056483 RepID=UPI0025AB333A|nr:hypothetical protein [Chlorogloeopsis sp. ULAP01]MDM9384868.1 hypothetical protein [Chlorogloeopsis sp. ULAP01]